MAIGQKKDLTGKLVLVEWVDASSVPVYWHFKVSSAAENGGVVLGTSVGYVVQMTPDELLLAQSKTDACWGGLFSIPRKVINKIKELK